MSSPKAHVVQMKYQNPDTSAPLFIPVLVIANTPDEVIEENITINSAKDLEWLRSEPEHEGVAIMVGGGPSASDNIQDILELQDHGGTVFAMNAASQWCRYHDIGVDYQCILDAKKETAVLVDIHADKHLFGSQVSPETMDSVKNPIVFHLETGDVGDIENCFPEERKNRGGYVLVGGGIAVGNTALCAVYAMGFRKFQIFGYDSSHRDDRSHSYEQPMNQFIPNVETEWAGRKFTSSVAMKAQAEKFQLTSCALKNHGCEIVVHGDGLLPAMHNTSYDDLSEKEKYQLMWEFDTYRLVSPGEHAVDLYITSFDPKDRIIDFGCGTGRAGIKFIEHGLNVTLIDFTDNCRDYEAQSIPFLQWDLTEKIPVHSPNGFCTDVMEHIPTEDVMLVVNNIMDSADKVFFQISTIDDSLGEMIDQPLHLTVRPHAWWVNMFAIFGFKIEWESDLGTASLFYITH